PPRPPTDPEALGYALATRWARQGEWGGSTLSRDLTFAGIQQRVPDWCGVTEGFEGFLHCGETTHIAEGQFPRFAAAYRARLDREAVPLAAFCERFDGLLAEVRLLLRDLALPPQDEALLHRYVSLHREMQPYSYVFGYGEELVVRSLVRDRLASAGLSGAEAERAEWAAFAPPGDDTATARLTALPSRGVPATTVSLLRLTRRQAEVRTLRRELWNRVEAAVLPHLLAAGERLQVPGRLVHELTAEELLSGLPPPVEELRARASGATFIAYQGRAHVFTGEDHARVAARLQIASEAIPQGDLTGFTGNPGRAVGIVRVVTTVEASERFRRGEVLVSDMTSPELLAACAKAAAIVTDRGGVLCHAAIVSREFGIPCVLGTEYATRTLRDGDLVEVDATEGKVRVLKRG
ncbi:MAG TPA: PEP-utilizing enzyme, partial [Candidatus Thermoplasmatota archaeon]|nr:PEP-utilizing enzyme [Candidatus Thermoplasmatota archaeon]